ncbi:MAG: EI24 domain-containing protein, partial [Thermodesulfobacteriota bacterium]
ILTGRAVNGEMSIVRSLTIELKRLVLYLGLLLILLVLTVVLSFIPALQIVIPVLWAVFTSLVLAFEFLSYPLDRRDMELKEKLVCMRSVLFRSLGFGVAAYFAMMVPVLNLMVIPSAVIGATGIAIDID